MLLSRSKQLMVLSFSFFLKNETNHSFVEINLKQLVCLCCAWHDIIFLWIELDIIPFSLAFVPIVPPLPTHFGLFCFLFTLALECIYFYGSLFADKFQSQLSQVQFSSVTQSCLILCDPMNRSMPGLPVHHQFPEFTQTHIHRVRDAIQPSHPLLSPSPPAPNPSQHQGPLQWVNSLHEVAKVLDFQL